MYHDIFLPFEYILAFLMRLYGYNIFKLCLVCTCGLFSVLLEVILLQKHAYIYILARLGMIYFIVQNFRIL